MSELEDRVSKFIDILKSGAPGAAQLSIPSNRDRLVSEVLQLFINAVSEQSGELCEEYQATNE